MHTLRVTLRQHTPLIHFQHDQDGATLRASEVKPKLDRYILTKLGNGYYQEGVKLAKANGWLVGKGEHPALDYKMRIEAEKVEKWTINERQIYTQRHELKGKPFVQVDQKRYLAKTRRTDNRLICDLKQYPLYFANMDADSFNPDECRKFSFTESPIGVVLIVPKVSLYRHILDADLLNDFFFQTNFGTRQSKGFGSFGIDKKDPNYRQRLSQYRFCINLDDLDENIEYIEDEFKLIFEYIELFYRTLRGGINLKNNRGETVFYFKSLAYKYADDCLNAKWDKRKIKEVFYGIEPELKPNTYDIRDMLGFSTNEQWLSYRDSIVKSSEVGERMQSPILFKPIYDRKKDCYTINILFQDNKVGVPGFKAGNSVNVRNSRGVHFSIDLPQNFSIESYFQYVFQQLDIDIYTYVDDFYQNHRYFNILNYIYSQIKENL
ncbi:MAG: hypothetical protein IKQ52_08160 [Bacteroidales bacterium]|nr:hypothetical protein [Bacteroidales bacterium]